MYHFLATCAPEPLKLSERVQIPGHIRQYLKDFQVDTLRFLHSHLANRDFCILNDESGLGKCVATAVYLGAIAKNNKCLIVVQNDDELVAGWQFHFDVLTKLSVGVLGPNINILEPLPNIIIAKWANLRSMVDGNKYNFDYIIIDNRGQMMSNNFCMSMLLSNYEHKVNLLISSIDVTSDLKLLHNSLRLGGHLEYQYEQFKFFEAKYKLPEFKDVLNKTADLEQYFLKREMISDYCKDIRLRRYVHQFEDQLPLVDAERYRISLELWHTISSSSGSNDNSNNLNANSETATEELFNQAQALNREICGIVGARQSQGVDFQHNEASEDADNMSPLLIDSESCSSGEAEEVIEMPNHEAIMAESTRTEPDVYEFVDLSNEQGSEEYIGNSERQHITNKSTGWQSNLRSLTKKGNNQKTSVIQDEQGIAGNTKDLEESKVSAKKTNPQCCKETLEKKTIDEQKGEHKDNTLKLKTNVNINSNKNSSSFKRHIKKKNEKHLDEVAKKQKSVDIQSNSDSVKLNIRRGLRQMENNSKKTSEKIKSTENDKDAMKTKRKTLDQTKETFKKPKTTDKEASSLSSAAQRDTLHEDKQPFNEKLIDKRKTDQEKNAKIKLKPTKSNQNIGEISPRRLRQVRAKADVHNDKCSVMAVKAACSASVSPTSIKKNSSKYDVDGRNKSSSNSTKCDTEKRNHKDDPKNKPRVEVPTTPTARNTRRMQRLTRSSDSFRSKYMTLPLTLQGSRRVKKRKSALTNNCDSVGTTDKQEDVGKSVEANNVNSSKKNKNTTMELANDIRKETQKDKTREAKGQKTIASEEAANVMDLAILPCSDTTEDMQCGQKIIADTHSDNGFLRPPTPIRVVRNSEPKHFLPTPSSFTESEVVFVPPPEATNKTQQIVVLSSSTDDGSLSSQQFAQSRRTRALKQKRSLKRPATDRERLAELSSTPTFGELLAKQRVHRKSPDIFSASTDLGLTCTQPEAADKLDEAETFQGFKIFGSEVKQMQQQHAVNSSGKQSKSKQVLSRGRSCLNILEKMFEPPNTDATDNSQRKQTKNPQQSSKKSPDAKLVKRTTRGSQPVVPSLPNTVSVTQLQQTQNHSKHKQKQGNKTTNHIISGPMVDEQIFEITNNDAFGSMMRINANGEISPVQTTRSQQTTQHNKITNYLIGTTQLTPTEATFEERTPSKRGQIQLSGIVARRSPKTRSTQSTKLTKWFPKNGATLNDSHTNAEHNEMPLWKHTRSAIAKRLKARWLDLAF